MGRAVQGYLTLFAAQLAIGAAAIFARFALLGTGPITASALRLALAALPLGILALLSPRERGAHAATSARDRSRTELALGLAGLALAVHFAAWIASLQYTSVGVSTLLVCTTPLWTSLYETFVQRRARRPAFWTALLLAALGLVLVVTTQSTAYDAPSATGIIEGHAAFGDALALAGSLAIGVYLLIVRKVSTNPRVSAAYPTLAIVSRTYAWAACALMLGALLERDPPPGSDLVAWGGILGMALISQLLGHTALNAAVRTLAATTVALATLLEPVFAALLAALIFHETFTPWTALGGCVILAAIALVLREEARPPGP